METIIINGVTCVVSNATAEQYRREVEEEKAEYRNHWILWHWYARRWAMYGNKFDYDGDYFSDMYKDENGFRPRMSREEIFWFLYGREVWIKHGRH